jgi:hypothetical protein
MTIQILAVVFMTLLVVSLLIPVNRSEPKACGKRLTISKPK